MIVGKGLIASEIERKGIDNNDIIFFASGVSNSAETRKEEFLREKSLIEKTISENKGKYFVYFSSCSIYEDNKTPYALHKINMESLISKSCNKYNIFRLPQVVGFSENPTTLLNFLYSKITLCQPFEIWSKVKRNLIDVEDIIDILSMLIENVELHQKIINIASPYSLSMQEIIDVMEEYFNNKANYKVVEKGGEYIVDIEIVKKEINIKKIFLPTSEAHVKALLMKYF